MTRWRTSGARIGGSGSEMSSKAIVRRMPGRSSCRERLGVPERVLEGVADRGVGIGERRERLGRVDDPGPDGKPLERNPSPCQNSVGGVERSTSRTNPGLGLTSPPWSSWPLVAPRSAAPPRAEPAGRAQVEDDLHRTRAARRAAAWRTASS